MMFILHISFSAALITFAIGCALLAWSKKETAASGVLKFGGITVVIFSILNFLCIGYYGIRYWQEGYYRAPTIMSHDPKMGMEMMHDMKDMMGKMQGMQREEMKEMPRPGTKQPPAGSPEEHQEHH